MQQDLFSASEKGHAAAKASADRADRESADWTKKATILFQEYASLALGPFLTEEARQYAERNGLTSPPDGRAWGHVAKAAQRAGITVSAGFGSAKSSNGSAKVLWRKKETQ